MDYQKRINSFVFHANNLKIQRNKLLHHVTGVFWIPEKIVTIIYLYYKLTLDKRNSQGYSVQKSGIDNNSYQTFWN